MDRSDLELVLAVRQHGSLVQAKRSLQLAPSGVTKRLASLGAHLGLRLFQLAELAQHDCLVVRETRGGANQRFDHWRLWSASDEQTHHVAVRGPLSSNSGERIRDCCLAGRGIMLRSLWDIVPRLSRG